MTDYMRVQWRATGHESTVPVHRFDQTRHRALMKPALDRHGDPLPPKFRTDLAGAARPRPEPASSSFLDWVTANTVPVPVADVAPEETGHEADHEGES